MNPQAKTKFVILAVLDGWGLASDTAGNAIAQAETVNMDRFWLSYPHTQLTASGESVGLPHGEAGNTEVGHINLGAGRIVYQDLTRINMSIADGTFYDNKVLNDAIDHAEQNNSNLHLMGLIGAGGVHSSIEHIYALIQLAGKRNFERVYLHLFTDGRDSPPTAALTYINQLREVIKREGVGQIASIMGRYWAMDRDLRWERTEKAYDALTEGKAKKAATVKEAIQSSYDVGKTDEFIEPTLITDQSGNPTALVKDNDSVVFFNFRIDRPRQLTKSFVSEEFQKSKLEWDFDPYAVKYEGTHDPDKAKKGSQMFERGKPLNNLYFVMMTEYGRPLVDQGAKVAFPPEKVDIPIGRVISEAGYRQLRVAESEKERFVTFYFNGQHENPYDGEDRIIIPSPKVSTYDQKPEMSAVEITDALLDKVTADEYPFALINYANADMVGHTGNIGPAVKACEVVDECIGRLANHALAYGGTLIITADHGNAEEMINNQTGQIDTEHSSFPVPFIAVSKNYLGNPQMLHAGILADVAPTTLSLLGIPVPDAMIGRNLLAGL